MQNQRNIFFALKMKIDLTKFQEKAYYLSRRTQFVRWRSRGRSLFAVHLHLLGSQVCGVFAKKGHGRKQRMDPETLSVKFFSLPHAVI